MSKPTASFDGNDLATVVPGLIVVKTNPNKFPNRTLTVGQLSNADKSVQSSAFYKDKKINVIVEIGRNTRELLDDSVDILYSILQNEEATLIMSVGSGTRQWTATLSNITITDMVGGHATFDIEFQCSDPIGIDTASTNLFSTALTNSSSTTNFVLGGTAKWQQPVITITFSALTGGTAKIVTVGNSATGQTVSITRTWVAGDVLVIDSKLKKVTVNGTEVAFTGAIPEWAGPSNGATQVAGSMDYTDTLTTRTRSMVGTCQKRYT
jgi:phage-related protein